jgi:hypothetical protein
MAVTEFTSAPAGTGKTAMRGARFTAEWLLPHTQLTLYTNFPLNVEAIADYVIQRHPDMVRSRLIDRIKFIPSDVLKSWSLGESGIEDYFGNIDLDGCRVAIDEVHTYVNAQTPGKIVQQWKTFLGTLRHRGCEFECLSQNESKVHKAIKDEAGERRCLFNSENKSDFLFGIKMEDWYELRAKLTGRYQPWIFETIHVEVLGKWREDENRRAVYQLRPELFPLFDSYSAPHQGGNKAKGKVREYQQRSFAGLLLWFMRRNFFRVAIRCLVALTVAWLCFGGGMVSSINWFLASMERTKPAAAVSTSSPPAQTQQSVSSSESTENTANPAGDAYQVKSVEDEQRAVIAQLKMQVAERDKELDRVRTESARFAEIVSLFGQQVTLRSGVTVDVGEQIPIGPLKGRTIKGVNHAKRRVILDDGSVLPLSP